MMSDNSSECEKVPLPVSSHKKIGFKLKDCFQLVSSLLLPMALGVFTVVITFQQQRAAQQQRDEDRYAAHLQRERDQNASDQQRQLERNLTDERYKNDVLDTYIRDLSTLLKDGDGSLTGNHVIATVAAIKTLNIFRQLDSTRNNRILRFLHETKALSRTNNSGHLDLSSAELHSIDFRMLTNNAVLENLFLTNILLNSSTFAGMKLNYISFFRTKLYEIDFGSLRLENGNFSYTTMDTLTFSSSQLITVVFSSSAMKNINFAFATMNGAIFSDATMSNISFQRIQGAKTIFSRANLHYCTFEQANLKRAIFRNANISTANFSGANLYMADFTGTSITDEQLLSAISIQGALLPNGTFGQDQNLILNGKAHCNRPLAGEWTLQNGSIITQKRAQNSTECYYVLESTNTGAFMSQAIDLSDKWNFNIWPSSIAILKADLSVGVSIELRAINKMGSIHDRRHLYSSSDRLILSLSAGIESLDIIIQFHPIVNGRQDVIHWCDNIKLNIVYDSHLETTGRLPNIPPNARWLTMGIVVVKDLSFSPRGLAIDQEGVTIYIADYDKDRVVSWTIGEQNSRELMKNLKGPTNILIDEESNSIIIADPRSTRLIRSFLPIGNTQMEIIMKDIGCNGLAMDDGGSLYVTVVENQDTIHQVRRFSKGNTTSVIVAGSNRYGSSLRDLNNPFYVAINSEGAIYISDNANHRVVKWEREATEGTVVAGFEGKGSRNTQLNSPMGIAIDADSNLYVADFINERIVRYRKDEKTADILIDSTRIESPIALAFDHQSNLYVTGRYRLYRFSPAE